MKKIIIPYLFITPFLFIQSCKVVDEDTNAFNADTAKPYRVSVNAQILVDTYTDLIRGNNVHTTNPSNPVFTVWSSMPAKGYNSSGIAGIVTFDSYYQHDSTFFRNIWADAAWEYQYYGAYVPDTIIYPFAHDNTQNHVYEARFIAINDYKSISGTKDYTSLKGKFEIKDEDIKDIVSMRMESVSGFINTTEPSNYTNINSSKGIVCVLHMKSGKYISCYIINNYDGAGTLVWKVKNL